MTDIKTELLAPAGDLEKLKIAVLYGADAVYIGGEAYGLRAKAKNFDINKMKEGIEFAHSHNVKVYVTANIYAHNNDFEGMAEYFKEIETIWRRCADYFRSGRFLRCKRSCAEYGNTYFDSSQ